MIKLPKGKKITNSLETFKELIFNSRNYRRIKNNISNQERKALKDVKIDTSKTCRIQDKGFCFVVVCIDNYYLKRWFANLNEVPFNS